MIEKNNNSNWLSVNDLRIMFKMGDTKARKVMAVVPSKRIGKKQYVLQSALEEYIEKNNGIEISWG